MKHSFPERESRTIRERIQRRTSILLVGYPELRLSIVLGKFDILFQIFRYFCWQWRI